MRRRSFVQEALSRTPPHPTFPTTTPLYLAATLPFSSADESSSDDFPSEGPAETVAHISVSLTLPATADLEALLANDTLTFEFRRVFAVSAGADADAGAPYALIMDVLDLETNESTLYDLAASFNRYPEEPLDSRRMLRREGEGAAGRRAMPARTAGWTLTTWYLYGHDFVKVGESKDADAPAIVQALLTGLTDPTSWTTFIAEGGGSIVGLTAAQMAGGVDPDSVSVTLPRLRVRPAVFGDMEASAVGSIVGVAVFLVGVVFVALPGLIEKFAAARRAAGAGEGGGGAKSV